MGTVLVRRRMPGRILTIITATALVAALVPVTAPGTAEGCEVQVKLPVTARGFAVPDDGSYLDGVITNDTSQTQIPNQIKISWGQDSGITGDRWVDSRPLAPGDWSSFHVCWPEDVPTTWTPVVEAYAYPSGDKPNLELTVGSVSAPTATETGGRSYTVSVTNNNAFPVSCIDLVGVEAARKNQPHAATRHARAL